MNSQPDTTRKAYRASVTRHDPPRAFMNREQTVLVTLFHDGKLHIQMRGNSAMDWSPIIRCDEDPPAR